MDKNQSLIKIDDQLYKIEIAENEGLLNITMIATVIHNSYISILNDNAILRITERAGYIRNMCQFHKFLIEGANHKSGFNLTGKLNPGDNSLTLLLKVRLNTPDDEIMIYTIELTKIHKENIIRIEEMMLDLSNTLSNFPIGKKKIKNWIDEKIAIRT